MKKLLLLVLATAGIGWLAPQSATAQYYYLPFLMAGQNPGGVNTDDEPRADQLPAGSGWARLITGTAATAATPIWSPVQTMPWSFQLDGQPVTSFKVSTTGVLTFTTTATAVPPANNVSIPSALIPDKSICLWGMSTGVGDFIISKVYGTAPNRQLWVQFNSCTIPGAAGSFLYWSIVLEESSNAIYMVNQRSSGPTSLTLGVQVNATTAYQTLDSPNVDSPDQNDASPADNSYYQFLPGTQPAYDLSARSLVLPTFIGITAGPVELSGDVLNLGTQTITSYDLNYSLNGGAPVTQPMTGVSIPSLGADTYATPVSWQPTANGPYTVRVWASNLNGNPDAVPANDTVTRFTTVVDTTVQRTVMMESFTSSTCGPCELGNINIRAVQRANPGKSVKIAYQQNFPGPLSGADPYYTAEGVARFQYYSGSYVPYVLLDGGWGDNSQSLTGGILSQFHDVPAVVSVSSDYTVVGRTVTANAHITPYANFAAGDVVLHMVITERHTQNNARTNGETDFYNVMKKMMPDADGTTLGALTSRQQVNMQQTYTFPATNTVEYFDSLEVVVFVQDLRTKQVLNGSDGLRTNPTGLSADEATLGALSIAPNPAAGAANVYLSLRTAQTVSADVLDALGRVVATVPAQNLAAGAHALPLALTGIGHGLYVVRVKTGDATRTRRLVVE